MAASPMETSTAIPIETKNFQDDAEKGKAGIFLSIPGMNAKKNFRRKYEDKNVSFRWIEKTPSHVHLEVSIGGKTYFYKHDMRKNIIPSKTEAKIATEHKVLILLAKADPQESWSAEDEYLLS